MDTTTKLQTTTTSTPDERCPHTGRSARWCSDRTHLACAASQAETVAFDRKWEGSL